MLLLFVIISPNMPNRSVVAMVAEFVSLTILIQNTLLREIIISSTRTTRVNELYSIPQLVMIYFHMQTLNSMHFVVIQLRFKEKMMIKKNMAKILFHVFISENI